MSRRQSRTADLFRDARLRQIPGENPGLFDGPIGTYFEHLKYSVHQQEVACSRVDRFSSRRVQSADMVAVRSLKKEFTALQQRDKICLDELNKLVKQIDPSDKALVETRLRPLLARRIEALKSMKNKLAELESQFAKQTSRFKGCL